MARRRRERRRLAAAWSLLGALMLVLMVFMAPAVMAYELPEALETDASSQPTEAIGVDDPLAKAPEIEPRSGTMAGGPAAPVSSALDELDDDGVLAEAEGLTTGRDTEGLTTGRDTPARARDGRIGTHRHASVTAPVAAVQGRLGARVDVPAVSVQRPAGQTTCGGAGGDGWRAWAGRPLARGAAGFAVPVHGLRAVQPVGRRSGQR
jgi:hypothetical protein